MSRYLSLGPELRKLNGWQFRALLTEDGPRSLELANLVCTFVQTVDQEKSLSFEAPA
jgi:hypothetical protein